MSNFNVKDNISMLVDFYEFTMSNGYFKNGFKDKTVVFDLFFRKIPDGGGYAIMAGVEQIIDYIKNLKFDDDDIEYLKGQGIFDEEFLEYLRNFKFTSSVWAIPGSPIMCWIPIFLPKCVPPFRKMWNWSIGIITRWIRIFTKSLLKDTANLTVNRLWEPEFGSGAVSGTIRNSAAKPTGLVSTAAAIRTSKKFSLPCGAMTARSVIGIQPGLA